MLSIPGGFELTDQKWADFGCGTGTFTLALAHYLGAESQIIAVDKNGSSLNKIPDYFNNVIIRKKEMDFTDIDFPSNNFDGILMANSLHYVQDQKVFIERVKNFLKSDGCFLIVEYDTNRSNPWIPFPLSFDSLVQLFKKVGFQTVEKINERPSKYNQSNLYSAVFRLLP